MANTWQADPVLSVEHITMRFGGLVAIDDLSLLVDDDDARCAHRPSLARADATARSVGCNGVAGVAT